jgi:hypothetical protein
MKRKCRAAALLLALTLALGSSTALAANTNETTVEKGDSSHVSSAELNSAKNAVTLQLTGLTAGEQYLVVMLRGTKESVTTPTENNILYIDQNAADSDGKLKFEVYPKSVQDSVIMIYGADSSPFIAAVLNAPFILGDLNNDTYINSSDAVLLNRYLAGLTNLSDTAMLAADVFADGNINSSDAVRLNRYLAGLQDL